MSEVEEMQLSKAQIYGLQLRSYLSENGLDGDPQIIELSKFPKRSGYSLA
jgi:hypothetical protein